MGNNKKLNEINDKLIDLELAKVNHKNTRVAKFIPAVVFIGASYYSFLLAFGLLFGYLASKIFSKYFLESGKVDCVYINCGKKYKLHLHHWILGLIFLLLVWVLDSLYLPSFFLGTVLGIIAHDIYDYNDWHKVLVKSEVEK